MAKLTNDQMSKITARIWKDKNFKELLETNPKAALSEFGISIPDDVDVECLFDTSNKLYLAFPSEPSKTKDLSPAELENIAAAGINASEGCVCYVLTIVCSENE